MNPTPKSFAASVREPGLPTIVDWRGEKKLGDAVRELVESICEEQAEDLYFVAEVLTVEELTITLVTHEPADRHRHDEVWQRLAESLSALTRRRVSIAIYRQAEHFAFDAAGGEVERHA